MSMESTEDGVGKGRCPNCKELWSLDVDQLTDNGRIYRRSSRKACFVCSNNGFQNSYLNTYMRIGQNTIQLNKHVNDSQCNYQSQRQIRSEADSRRL